MERKGKKPGSEKPGPSQSDRDPKTTFGDSKKKDPMGKRIVFIVEGDLDKKNRSAFLRFVFKDPRLDAETSGSELLESFLTNPEGVKADVLIVESSMKFFPSGLDDPKIARAVGLPGKKTVEENLNLLKRALRIFRKNNPKSYVIVCSIGYFKALEDLEQPAKGPKVIDEIEKNPLSGKDKEMLNRALDRLNGKSD